MRYDDRIIEEVREANDIVDVIGQRVRLTRKGANYFGLCPFHGEKTASFSVSPRKQIYYCFGCGAGGNVISFLMNYENYSFTEALKSLADRANIELPEISGGAEEQANKDLKNKLLDINKTAAMYYYDVLHTPDGAAGYEYFTGKRGLSERTVTHFGLGFSPKASDALYRFLKDKGYGDDIIKASGLAVYNGQRVTDRFWNRVIFPIMDTNNRVIGFGGRVMGDALPKYLNSPETFIFDKSSTLYGLNFAKKSRRKFLLLCEGYMDVIALHQAGFTNAVASLGTALNEKHARLLKRYTDNVILTQDSDEAGTKAKLRAFPILYQAGLNVRILEIKGAKDPDELIRTKGPEAYEECIKNAKNAFIFMVEVLKRDYDLSDPAEKTAFYNETADRLCMFSEALERDNYTESVSREFMIDRDELKKMVEKRFERSGTRAARDIIPAEASERRNVENTGRDIKSPASAKHERLLASWIYERPELKKYVVPYVDLESFCSGIAADIIRAVSVAKSVDAADFMDRYKDDEEALREAAAIFAADDINNGIGDYSRSELEKGLTEAIRSIKLCRIDEDMSACGSDIGRLNSLLKEKNELSSFKVVIDDEDVSEA